jgi:DNA-binding phage protein
MGDPKSVFWSDLEQDLQDPEILREYIIESVRIQAIDEIMNQIEGARADAGLTKAELARAINASPDSVRRLLSSKPANPTLGTLAEVAAALGMKVTLSPFTRADSAAITEPLRTGKIADVRLLARNA